MSDATQKAAILRPSEIKAHERGGGARTIPLVTSGVGSRSLLNGITEFGPGAGIPLHTHNCEAQGAGLRASTGLSCQGSNTVSSRPNRRTSSPTTRPL